MASPTVGVPQGLAVYQNGVRVNESFGDTVNWDFIPEYAIRRLDVFPSNPVFGLNALGGAISIEMKNGFNYQGREVELLGGSNWRRSAMAQVGMQQGNTSFYVAADALNDNGWRDRSPSELRRVYADVGVLGDRSRVPRQFHRRLQLLRRRRGDPDPDAESALERGLHDAADHEEPARLPEYDLQLSGERHAFDQEQRLLPRLLAEARRRQHQRRRAVRPGLVPGTSCASTTTTIRCSASTGRRCPTLFSTAGRPARSTAPRRRRIPSAVRCRRRARRRCSATTTTSSSARASIAATCNSRPRANSAPSPPTCSSPAPA